MAGGEILEVDGRRISITNLSKVLYPATGTRKYDVIDYYSRIAEVMLPHLRNRIVTRKRWPNGVESTPFFEKDLPDSAPDWVRRHGIQHSERVIEYALAEDRATLVWLAQMAALEIHVPQWRLPIGPDGERMANRIVFDLDPGPRVPLHETAAVAVEIRNWLGGTTTYPVTSGGKGIHIYARLPKPVSSEAARKVAREVADEFARQHSDFITANMSKKIRDDKVFIDWSQNNASKTTLSPYSLRGREQPWVAAPRTWDEIEDPTIAQLLYTEVLDRVADVGDLLAGLDAPYDDDPATASDDVVGSSDTGDDLADPDTLRENITSDDHHGAGDDHAEETRSGQIINLREYRRKRDESKTPEPFGDENHRQRLREAEDEVDEDHPESAPRAPIFVIQEHHARRLHYDFRLEHDGVLVSWAVPKNLPTDPDQNRLAVQTEDHPMDYAEFEGDIPAGEYGGGHVSIWDKGTFELEKWRDKEVIVRLHGERLQGRYALIRTGDKNWLAHLMTDEPRPIVPDSLTDPRPMLATDEPIDKLNGRDWAFEGKWDGYRLLVRSIGGEFRLTSRSGIDMTNDFPEFASITDDLGLMDVVLDGEAVAIDSTGRTNFTLFTSRRHTEEPYTLKLHLFDILYLNGTSLLRKPWSVRREILEELAPAFRRSTYIDVPPLLPTPASAAIEYSREHNMEGVVAKRRDSVYQQGRRSTKWLKHKNWSDIEVVVGGYRPGRGNRSHTIGSLLLGLPEETGLRYVGRVGTGFTDAQLRSLAEELEPLKISRSPFLEKLDRPIASSAVWVLPKIVGEVRFMDWTTAGHLRHPSWRGIRRDKLPGDL
ncbi:ATP-dependent DNA ligase [Gordonia amicalis]|uniref:ATP-dependent DNA ligase n=1 Tax=Gordonia amicalis TaxID=89053 RepID=UPI0002A63526|nr:ATP-dependent DNA ligase [Gordonia amicalis]MBA5848126.1 ATP-dependent DNA ligase [Gordonia amicalis]MCZ0915166.1 ATP-dependent DNA ligase [Gordonia amicalis]MCZ4578464.1 ATP-dependent DNA ligase [Gordonia amicalis]MDV7172558.1 ATP-dependent DNA ligase [Gordonia amicalis]NKX76146.1 ATP-dependent DNA ligase [Gordonia amicalis]